MPPASLESRAPPHRQRSGKQLIALVLLVAPSTWLQADTVYKSVDADGHVVYSDRADGSSSQSTLVQIEGTPEPPHVLHFCWTNCFTLTLDNGIYTRADGTNETWTVERFDSSTMILHRHDAPVAWNGFSTDVAYRGQIANDQLINITVNGAPVRDIQMAWGDALGTLPGSNAERDQRTEQLQATDIEMRAADAPPPLPDDEQPPSIDGYAWTPGYWAWDGGAYEWVTGAWMPPPRVGVLWTPGYWAFAGTVYVFHRGYWGPHVGYYGGINYGYGYAGVGFTGGRWIGNSFAYNKTADTSAVGNGGGANRVSYNGGPGGISAAPTAAERAAAAEPHVPPTALQRESLQQAATPSAPISHANGSRPAAAVIHTPRISNVPPVITARNVATPARAAVAPSAGELTPMAPVNHATTPPIPKRPVTAPARSASQPKP